MKKYLILSICVGFILFANFSKAQGKFFTGSGSGYSLGFSSAVLPIELLYFKANTKVEGVLLEWVTVSEINNDFFTIERSNSGIDFEPVGIIQGSGNSNNEINYEFIDRSPRGGISYYRLKQTDFDGQFDYSEIKRVSVESSGRSIIFPNPINDENELTVHLSIEEPESISILIYDFKGTEIFKISDEVENGLNQFKISLNGYKPNLYFLKIFNSMGQSFGTYKIIKE